jgi:hypothetical protein
MLAPLFFGPFCPFDNAIKFHAALAICTYFFPFFAAFFFGAAAFFFAPSSFLAVAPLPKAASQPLAYLEFEPIRMIDTVLTLCL